MALLDELDQRGLLAEVTHRDELARLLASQSVPAFVGYDPTSASLHSGNLVPSILSGSELAFARAVREFGSVVLISGNIPFDTQVASVFVYSRIESDAVTSAAAVSVVLLLLSVLVLVAIRALGRFGARHEG